MPLRLNATASQGSLRSARRAAGHSRSSRRSSGQAKARCRYRSLALALAALTLLTHCESLAPRVIPVQTSRTVQIEHFRQRFHVHSIPRAERIFQKILGMQNYDALSASEWAPYMKSLLAGKVEAIGSLTFVMSLMPSNLDYFFFEGSGQYTVRDVVGSKALLSGTFELIDDGPRPLSQLDAGVLHVRTRHTIVRHFALDKTNYVHQTEFSLRLHVRTLDDALYITAYDLGHEVGMLGPQGKVEAIGCLEFLHRPDGRKVIDMRGRDLIRDDYAERLENLGFEPARAFEAYPWVSLGPCQAQPLPVRAGEHQRHASVLGRQLLTR